MIIEYVQTEVLNHVNGKSNLLFLITLINIFNFCYLSTR